MYSSMAPENLNKNYEQGKASPKGKVQCSKPQAVARVLGPRPWLFIVGQSPLDTQGYLGPSPGCLISYGRPMQKGAGQQGSSAAHCAGFRATKARPPRSGSQDGGSAQGALHSHRRVRSSTPRGKEPWTAQSARVRGTTALPHPSRHRAACNNEVLSQNSEKARVSRLPSHSLAHHVRHDMQVGRVITSQDPQTHMSLAQAGTRPKSSPATLFTWSGDGRAKWARV